MNRFLRIVTVILVALTMLVGIGIYQSMAGSAEGKGIFASKKCGDCHLMAGAGIQIRPSQIN